MMESVKEAQDGFAEVNGTRLYYEVSGAGQPLVLIHGWSFDSRCWDDQTTALASRFRVLRYDLRGFGRSALPQPAVSYSHTDDLVALLDLLQMERVHLVAHSYGGNLAFEFAFRCPERVRSLLLPEAAIDVAGHPVDPEVQAWIAQTWRTAAQEGVEAARSVWLGGRPLAPAMRNLRSAARVRQMVEEYSAWHWERPDPVQSFPTYHVDQLGQIRAPALIILGLLSPPGYHEFARLQHEHLANSTFVSMKGVGHALNIEDPEEFNRIILAFLDRVAAS
jgi:pimeloyl-ACP methyl ester carboxylesterase